MLTALALLISLISLISPPTNGGNVTTHEVESPGLLIVAGFDNQSLPAPTDITGGELVVVGQRQESAPRIVLAVHVTTPGTVTINWANVPNIWDSMVYVTDLEPVGVAVGGGQWVAAGVELFPTLDSASKLITAFLGRTVADGGTELAQLSLGRAATAIVYDAPLQVPATATVGGPHWTGIAVPLG